MSTVFFITHPEVDVDPAQPVPRWHLSATGIARMRRFADAPFLDTVARVFASTEAKAIEAAGILAGRLGLPVQVDAGFDENDRSATGFLPPPDFQRMADAFFADPEASVRGWERAVDAQARVAAAFERALARDESGDVAILAHGGVGTLLYCRLATLPIARSHDQPFQGHYWAATIADRRILHGWRSLPPGD